MPIWSVCELRRIAPNCAELRSVRHEERPCVLHLGEEVEQRAEAAQDAHDVRARERHRHRPVCQEEREHDRVKNRLLRPHLRLLVQPEAEVAKEEQQARQLDIERLVDPKVRAEGRRAVRVAGRGLEDRQHHHEVREELQKVVVHRQGADHVEAVLPAVQPLPPELAPRARVHDVAQRQSHPPLFWVQRQAQLEHRGVLVRRTHHRLHAVPVRLLLLEMCKV